MTTTSATDTPILELGSLSKTFPGQVALDNASLVVRAGQVHALVGQNGSGKSTLIKVLAGYHRPDPGASIRFQGTEIQADHLSEIHQLPVHVMHQDLGLVGSLNAIENLALGRGFHVGRTGRIRWGEQAARARELLAGFGVELDVRAPVASLPPSEQAILALARALQDWDGSGGILVLDEPTAALPRPEVDRLFSAVRAMADHGAGVIFVSHRLDEVFEIADHVTVLRDGRVVASVPIGEIDHDGLIEAIVGRSVDELYTGPPPIGDDTVLELHGLWGDVVEDLHLAVRSGEVVGVAGLVGSGRDELPALIFGAHHRASGYIRVDGHDIPSDPHQAIAAGVAYVPSDRKGLGTIPSQTIRENVTLPRLGSLLKRGRLLHRSEKRDVSDWIDRVDLRPGEPERALGTLSGGNQQKAVLARWLRTRPRVLVLNEPTQGVDVGAKATIYALLAEAAAEGMAVVVASSEADELANICDRVLVMRNGRVGAELAGTSLTEQRIVQQMLMQE